MVANPLSFPHQPTRLEERLFAIYRYSFILFELLTVGFVLYIIVSFVLLPVLESGTVLLWRPLFSEPLFYAFVAAIGSLISVSTAALIPLTLFRTNDIRRAGIVVVFGSIGIGLCGSVVVSSLKTLFRLLVYA